MAKLGDVVPVDWVRRYPRQLGALAAALVAAATLSGCQDIGILHPAGPVGAANKAILLNAVYIMLAIIVPVIVATLGMAWWFRAGNPRAIYRPHFVYSGRIELLVWSVPLLTIMFLGGVAWVGSHDLDPYRPLASNKPPLRIQALSLDWKWLFIYPDEKVAAVNEMAVEAGRPVELTLTSASVMSAFFVPQFGSMIYTMNGMTTKLHLQSDRPGEFLGLASNLTGDGFSDMNFKARALAPDALGAWVSAARNGKATLDRAAYTELAKQSSKVPVTYFSSVAPNLFEDVVSQTIPPGPGPSGGPNPSVSPKSALGPICTPQRPNGEAAAATPTTTARKG